MRRNKPVSEEARRILRDARTIAVLGMKTDEEPDAAAYQLPKYLERHGYEILPVNPKLVDAGKADAVATLRELEEAPDVVQVFRSSAAIPGHLDELLELRPGAVWFQRVRNDEAAAKLRAAGIPVVQDECMHRVHQRLLREQREATASSRATA